jgi:hypothetical protein
MSIGLFYLLIAPYTLGAFLTDSIFYSRPSAQFQSVLLYPLYLLNSPFGEIGWLVYSWVPEIVVAGILIKRKERKSGRRLLFLYFVNVGLGLSFWLFLALAFMGCGAGC